MAAIAGGFHPKYYSIANHSNQSGCMAVTMLFTTVIHHRTSVQKYVVLKVLSVAAKPKPSDMKQVDQSRTDLYFVDLKSPIKAWVFVCQTFLP
jgi:hypothetical protein